MLFGSKSHNSQAPEYISYALLNYTPFTVDASVPPAGIYVVLRVRIKISWISLPDNLRATVSLLVFVYLSLLSLLLLFITRLS